MILEPSTHIDAIEARANAATPGPWWAEEHRHTITGDAEWVVWMREDKMSDNTILGEEDAEFIAHAREDVPKLIAEVRRLQAKIGGMIRLMSCVCEVAEPPDGCECAGCQEAAALREEEEQRQ
jgi:hypothetical protein